MRILSVTIIPPGENAQWWRISNIAKILELEGCEVDMVHYIVRGYESHKKLKEIKDGCKDSFIVSSPFSIPFKHFKRVYRRDYDIVYGNTYAGAFFSMSGKLARIPLVTDMHGIPEEFLLINGLKMPNMHKFLLMKLMNSIALRFSDKIICVSMKMIEYFHKEKNILYSKMVYFTNGVDLDFFKPLNNSIVMNLRNQLGIGDKFVFGYIGGLQKWQGVENFVKAAKKVNDRETVFLIVGGERNTKRGNLIFVPRVPRVRVPYYYSLCDVLVLPRPSHIVTEVAAPTKFAEYVAMGKSVLVTDVGDAADFVRQYKNGIVVDNSCPENLKEGILQFLEMDKGELNKMGKKSRELAKNEFDWIKNAKNLVKMLREVLTK